MNLLIKIRINIFYFITISLIVSFFTYPIYGEELSEEQKEIWKMEEKFWDTWNKEGADVLKAFYHKEAIIWGSNLAWPQDSAFTSNSGYYYAGSHGDNPIESFKLTLHEIKHFGNVSVVQYDAEVISFLKKQHKFRISNSWLKQDGKWVILGTMYSSCSNLPKCPE